jgi:hypothetical protein
MEKALNADVEFLSSDFKRMIVDDMVTAFENRLSVLRNIQTGVHLVVRLENIAECSIS